MFIVVNTVNAIKWMIIRNLQNRREKNDTLL